MNQIKSHNVKTPAEVNVDDILHAPSEPGCFGKGGSYWDRGYGGGGGAKFASMMGAIDGPDLSDVPWDYSKSNDENHGLSNSASEAGGGSFFDMWL